MQKDFLLLTNHPMVTCGTLPAPGDLLLDWRSEHVSMSAFQTCCTGIPVLSFRLQMPLLGFVSCPHSGEAGDELCSCPSSKGTPLNVGKIWGFALKTVFPAIKEWGARPVQVSQLPSSVSQTIRHKKLHHKGLKPSALILQNPFLGRLVAPCCNYRGLKPPQPASFPQTKHPTLRFWSHSVCCQLFNKDKTHFSPFLWHRWDIMGTLWMHHQAFGANAALPLLGS